MRVSRGIPVQAEAPVALTIGNFDGVHLGHQAMLACLKETAARLGLTACVMIFEPHPREFFAPDKAPTRLTSLREKLELLAAAGVWGTMTKWPDLIVAGFMAALFLSSSVQIVRQALAELGAARTGAGTGVHGRTEACCEEHTRASHAHEATHP